MIHVNKTPCLWGGGYKTNKMEERKKQKQKHKKERKLKEIQ